MRNSSVSIQIRVLICMIILLLVGGILHAQEKVQYTLTIERVGDGGTVVPGIGVFTYSAGSTAYINVVPTADWAFDHWEGAASGSGWYTQVYMDGNKTVTAVFVEAKWRLTIEHAGNAVGNTFPQAGVYGCIDGQSIGISSGTSPGVYFGGWSGDAHGASEFITVTMNSDKHIIATFNDTGYELNVYVEGEGGATPGPMGNPHRYAEGVIVSITAYRTNDLWRFDHWSGDLPETATPGYYILMDVPMNQNRDITAHFILKPWYTLTVEVEGEGSMSIISGFDEPIIVSTGIHEFDFIEWTYIRGEALATTPGWRFLRWEGDFGDMSATYPKCAFSMDQDRYVQCIFTNLTNVPDVIGSELSSATTAISNAFLSVGEVIEVCNDEYPEGYVFDQDPVGGTTVVMGSAVALWVSTGPCPPDSTNVPGVIGSELSSATNAITNALLSVGEVIELCNDEYPEGYVFDQDPVVGTTVVVGSTVALWVSTGPCPPEGEGVIEGEGTGEGEGAIEGEGIEEGEFCTWEETCPNFAWEIQKLAEFWGSTVNSLDTNQSLIPDEWEMELVKFLLCSPQGIWNDHFICVFNENYNILKTEPFFYTTYYSYRHVLAGLLTIGENLSNLTDAFQISHTYSSFEYPADIFPLTPDADADNDGMNNYEEYQYVLSYNGTKEEFVQLVFNLVLEGNIEGNIEGTQEGTVEGIQEGITEGEGIEEGEFCTWEESCPYFAWEIQKMAEFFGLSLNTLDTNQSLIPDDWEMELVKFLLCSPQGIWNDHFICVFTENYNILKTEPLYYTTYSQYRHVLAGLLTIGGNLSNLIDTLQISHTYSSFEYPADIFPLTPVADADNDGMSNYEEYQLVINYNGTKAEFVQLIFNSSPVPDYHTADTNRDNRIDLRELLRVIQFLNSGGFHCEEGTEDGYAPGYDESSDFSCLPHALDYNPQDWHISLEEILRAIQFFNSQGYELCPYLSEDHYCPLN